MATLVDEKGIVGNPAQPGQFRPAGTARAGLKEFEPGANRDILELVNQRFLFLIEIEGIFVNRRLETQGQFILRGILNLQKIFGLKTSISAIINSTTP